MCSDRDIESENLDMATQTTSPTALTDLELTVLGIVWKKAPCTAYSIMREFSGSPSSYYRGSAGTIYPLVHRLEKRRYLVSCMGGRGRRPHVTYELSRQGLAALRRWLTPPLPDAAAAITFDPLRTRVFFLNALTPGQRPAFVVHARKQLHAQLKVVEAECARYRDEGDLFSALAMDGALHVIRARIAWMTELRKRLPKQ
jgi:DNA-binding PadR family transcriptional regulator